MDNLNETGHGVDADNHEELAAAAKSILVPEVATAKQLQEAETKIEERMSSFERSMIRLTRAGVIVAIVTGIIFLGQLYEMIEGGTATDKLVGYAQTQANAAGDIAQASDDFTDSAKWMEEHMADAANAMQDNANAAESNVNAIQYQIRLEERAWVGSMAVTLDPLEVDKPAVAHAQIKNFGKTFALQADVESHLWFSSSKVTVLPKTEHSKITSLGVLIPDAIYSSSPVTPNKASAKDKELLEGDWYTYIWGEIGYYDVFKRHHETNFCWFRQGIKGDFNQCDMHNDAN